MWNDFIRNKGIQVYLVPVSKFKQHTKNYFKKKIFPEWLCLIPYKTAFSLMNKIENIVWICFMKIFLSSIPYVIWLNSPVASFKLICIFRLFPSNRINEWKENSIHNFRTFRNFSDINSLSLLFISDIDLIFNCEYIQYLWLTILLNYTNM